MRNHSGLFVTFEGGEGVGKSTLIDRLSRELTSDGYSVVQTREPGGCELGKHIRSLLLDQEAISKKAELLLFLANRTQHVEEVIRPALSQKKIVLCDRFSDSTRAYQGAGRHIESEEVEYLCRFATGDVAPDCTILLDVDPEIGFSRVNSSRDGKDRIEQEAMEFHLDVRKGFLSLAKQHPDRIHVIDASQSQDEVFKSVNEILKKKVEASFAAS